jgi:phage repressor protein C with HTH and peptisase S24 domain
MDVFDTRRKNLALLTQQRGEKALLSVLAGTAASWLSQILAGAHMGDDLARRIETARHLPYLWMDIEHSDLSDVPPITGGIDNVSGGLTLTNEVKGYYAEDETPDTHVKIRDTRILFAAGLGSPYETEEVKDGDYALYRKDWLEDLGVSEHDLIRAINHGYSMANYIKDGARILINTKDTEIDNDPESVYALRFDNNLRVKYVEKTPAGLILKSENSDFEDEFISAALCNEYVQIIGRVIEITNQTKRKKPTINSRKLVA